MAKEHPIPTVFSGKDLEIWDSCDLEQPRIKFLLEHVGNDKKILDIGCFIGNYTRAFAELGNELVGIDAGQDAIEEAKKRYPHIKFALVDAMDLKGFFAAEEFDCVIASEVIEHVINPAVFLENICYVLKKGGRLILTTQNSHGIQYRLRLLLGRFKWAPPSFQDVFQTGNSRGGESQRLSGRKNRNAAH